MSAKELSQYKIHSERVKELTGVEADLYVFTKDQLEEYHQAKLKDELPTEEEIIEEFYNLIIHGSHIITDENKNVWHIVEVSDIEAILNSLKGER